jgi:hypothetical protein
LTDIKEIAIVGMHAREARELVLAAEAVGLAVRPLAFGSLLAEAALAAHGPGSVRLPLAIVAGRYSLQRPALDAVLECIEVLRGTRRTLPAACVPLTSATVLGGVPTGRERGSPGSGDDGSPDWLGHSLERYAAPHGKERHDK